MYNIPGIGLMSLPAPDRTSVFAEIALTATYIVTGQLDRWGAATSHYQYPWSLIKTNRTSLQKLCEFSGPTVPKLGGNLFQIFEKQSLQYNRKTMVQWIQTMAYKEKHQVEVRDGVASGIGRLNYVRGPAHIDVRILKRDLVVIASMHKGRMACVGQHHRDSLWPDEDA